MSSVSASFERRRRDDTGLIDGNELSRSTRGRASALIVFSTASCSMAVAMSARPPVTSKASAHNGWLFVAFCPPRS